MGAIYTIDSKGSLQLASAIDVLSGLGSSFVEDFDSGPSISGSVKKPRAMCHIYTALEIKQRFWRKFVGYVDEWERHKSRRVDAGNGYDEQQRSRSGILRGLSVTTGYLYLGSVYEIYCEWVSQIPTLSAGADHVRHGGWSRGCRQHVGNWNERVDLAAIDGGVSQARS